MTFLSTSKLIADPALAAVVEQLAKATQIESSNIGYAGMPSQVYALSVRVTKLATPRQAVSLLRHESPVVRGYLAQYAIAAMTDEVDAVYPLLGDSSSVDTQNGCIGRRATVADVVLMALRDQVERPAAQQLLLRAARDPQLGDLRGEALQWVANKRPHEASSIAQGYLRETDQRLLEAAIRTLGMTRRDDSAPALCEFAGSANRDVRGAVAGALGSLQHACVEPTLRKLIADDNEYVQMLAGASYARTAQRDLAVVRRLLKDGTARVKTQVAVALAEQASTADLALLREHLPTGPGSSEVIVAMRQTHTKPPRPEVSAFLRELLAGPMGRDGYLRAQALEFLRDAGDRQSLPLFVSALQSSNIGERMAGAEGIAALGERGAARALAALLDDENPNGRLAAARALVAVKAVEEQKALQRAAARDTSWAKREMTELANRLK